MALLTPSDARATQLDALWKAAQKDDYYRILSPLKRRVLLAVRAAPGSTSFQIGKFLLLPPLNCTGHLVALKERRLVLYDDNRWYPVVNN